MSVISSILTPSLVHLRNSEANSSNPAGIKEPEAKFSCDYANPTLKASISIKQPSIQFIQKMFTLKKPQYLLFVDSLDEANKSLATLERGFPCEHQSIKAAE